MKILFSTLVSSLVLGSLFLAGLSAEALDCSRRAGSLPQPSRPAGTRSSQIPVQHIVVIMQENHSFDSYLGRLNQSQFYGSQIDGVTNLMSQPERLGKLVYS